MITVRGCEMATRNITFPDELYNKLKDIAKEKGLTVAAIIKIACDEYAKSEGK